MDFLPKQAGIEPNERTEMIDWLTIVVGWHRQIFENMTNEELSRIWKERVEQR